MRRRNFLKYISIFVLASLGFCCNSQPTKNQGAADAKTMIRAVVNGVLKDATFQQVEGVCTGTVVSDDLVYYYQRPTPLNDVHAIGTVLLAGAEVLQLLK